MSTSSIDPIIWKGLYYDTLEYTTIMNGDEITVNGLIAGTAEGKNICFKYEIILSSNWEFVFVRISDNNNTIFKLTKDESNRWIQNSEEIPEWDSYEYIDINLTPFTNSLPINHLDIDINTAKNIKVLYINLLTMEINPSTQCYTKLDDATYRYLNVDSGFERILQVDQKGIVINYPRIWRRIFTSTFSSMLQYCPRVVKSSRNSGMYDRLIGSWDVRVIDYPDNDERIEQTGEWHFSKILENRAIQDVWIVPKVTERYNRNKGRMNRYGTSIRSYSSETDIWTVTWINPVSNDYDRLTGKLEGKNLVHLGIRENGDHIRWTFKDITDDSFRWLGEKSEDDGISWIVAAEFFATRKIK
jgi:hypothetical protein